MAISAIITIDTVSPDVTSPAIVTCTVTNNGLSPVSVIEVTPTVDLTVGGGLTPSLSWSTGMVSPARPVSIGAGLSQVFTWGISLFDSASDYAIGAQIRTNAGQFLVPAHVHATPFGTASQHVTAPYVGAIKLKAVSDLGIGQVLATGGSLAKTLSDHLARVDVDGSAIPVVATGTVLAATSGDRAAREVWLEDFGEAGSGDWTAILNAAIAFLLGATGGGPGGKLKFKSRTYRIDGQILFPWEPVGVTQPNMVWEGQGMHAAGASFPLPTTGTVLNLRYGGANPPSRIFTRGLGSFTAKDLTLATLDAATSVPFVMTTGTTIHLDRVAFWGNNSKAGTTCDEDCVIFGGPVSGTLGTVGAVDDPFQGYGSTMMRCWTNRTRRLAWLRRWCNDTTVQNNTVWNQCGSNLVGGACIEISSAMDNGTGGNRVIGNLLEVLSYPYPIKIGEAAGTGMGCIGNTIAFNGCYDPTATRLCDIKCLGTAAYNLIIDGYHTAGGDLFQQEAGGTNRLIAMQAGWSSLFQDGLVAGSWTIGNPNDPGGNAMKGTAPAGGTFTWVLGGAAAAPALDLYVKDTTNPAERIFEIQRLTGNPGYAEFNLHGATRNRIVADSNLWLRSPAGQHITIGNATAQEMIRVLDNALSFYGSGPIAKQTATGKVTGTLGELQTAVTNLTNVLANLGLLTNGQT